MGTGCFVGIELNSADKKDERESDRIILYILFMLNWGMYQLFFDIAPLTSAAVLT